VVKSTTSSYVKGLGEGQPVVLSEIIRRVQSLPGVFSVKIISTTPTANDDRIVVADIEKAIILDSSRDITIG
jgi:tRNA A37 methylthiotransferase MiaB